jgi:phosphate transport system protein
MTRANYDESLKELYQEVIQMAARVESALSQTILALTKKDRELAKTIMENDDDIDDRNRKIEEKCINLIATQQPIASDLRFIISILDMITDLERIGDQSADICEIMLNIRDIRIINSIHKFSRMIDLAGKMVRTSIDAYAYRDDAMAKETKRMEEEMDELFEVVIHSLKEEIKQNPELVDECVNLLFITKYLERVGDHATNLCESVVYNVTGKHEHLN